MFTSGWQYWEFICLSEILQFSHLNLKRWCLSLITVSYLHGAVIMSSSPSGWNWEASLSCWTVFLSFLSYCAFVGRKRVWASWTFMRFEILKSVRQCDTVPTRKFLCMVLWLSSCGGIFCTIHNGTRLTWILPSQWSWKSSLVHPTVSIFMWSDAWLSAFPWIFFESPLSSRCGGGVRHPECL